MSVNSKAVFNQRVKAVGLTLEDVERLGQLAWRTYATFALASDGAPGQVAEASFKASVVEKVLGTEDMQ
eukprot:3108680-Amphidinium_carterae.1